MCGNLHGCPEALFRSVFAAVEQFFEALSTGRVTHAVTTGFRSRGTPAFTERPKADRVPVPGTFCARWAQPPTLPTDPPLLERSMPRA
jgi:hypothetical protein